jgi:hypothetical protein
LFSLAGYLFFCFIMMGMVKELQAAENDSSFPGFANFVPIWNLIIWWSKVRALIAQAKQRRGIHPAEAKGIVWYIFFAPYALAADLNDLAGGGGAPPQMGMHGGAPGGMMGGYPPH